MKKIILFIALLSFSNNLWSNNYLDTLKNDLEYFFNVSDSIDYVIVDGEGVPVDIDTQKMYIWVNDYFGSTNELNDFLDRTLNNLNLLALDNSMPNSSTEDYVSLIKMALEIENETAAAVPFKCHDRYKEDFLWCAPLAILGGWPGFIAYSSCVVTAVNNFYRCLEGNY